MKLPDGRGRVVRHAHGPKRAIQTRIGPVGSRDRGKVGAAAKIPFTSSILPKWARRTKSLDGLLPILYLRGISTGDVQKALSALLRKDAPNRSPAVITRLTAEKAGALARHGGSAISRRVWAAANGERTEELVQRSRMSPGS